MGLYGPETHISTTRGGGGGGNLGSFSAELYLLSVMYGIEHLPCYFHLLGARRDIWFLKIQF